MKKLECLKTLKFMLNGKRVSGCKIGHNGIHQFAFCFIDEFKIYVIKLSQCKFVLDINYIGIYKTKFIFNDEFSEDVFKAIHLIYLESEGKKHE